MQTTYIMYSIHLMHNNEECNSGLMWVRIENELNKHSLSNENAIP